MLFLAQPLHQHSLLSLLRLCATASSPNLQQWTHEVCCVHPFSSLLCLQHWEDTHKIHLTNESWSARLFLYSVLWVGTGPTHLWIISLYHFFLDTLNFACWNIKYLHLRPCSMFPFSPPPFLFFSLFKDICAGPWLQLVGSLAVACRI